LVAEAAASGAGEEVGAAADMGGGAEGAAEATGEFERLASVDGFFLTRFFVVGAAGAGRSST
jgi:hypothetical protein